ncbi:hypothetical protein V1264_003699 [Littorina saxatilis]
MKVDLSSSPGFQDLAESGKLNGCHLDTYIDDRSDLRNPRYYAVTSLLPNLGALVGFIWANCKTLPRQSQLRMFSNVHILTGLNGVAAVIAFRVNTDDWLPKHKDGKQIYRDLEVYYSWSFYLMIVGAILVIAASIVINSAPLPETEADRPPVVINADYSQPPVPNAPTQPPAYSAQPLDPTNPLTYSAQPLDPTNPLAYSVQPNAPPQPPTYSAQPLDPTNPLTYSAQPLDPIHPLTYSAEPLDPTNPLTYSAQPLDPTNPLTYSVQPLDPTNPLTHVQPLDPTNPLTYSNSAQPLDPTNPLTYSVQPNPPPQPPADSAPP